MSEESDELFREMQQETIDRCEPIDHPRSRLNPLWPFMRFPLCLPEPPKPFKLDGSNFKEVKPSKFKELVRLSKEQRRDEDE